MTPVGITHLKVVLFLIVVSFAGLFTPGAATFALAFVVSVFAALFIILSDMGDR